MVLAAALPSWLMQESPRLKATALKCWTHVNRVCDSCYPAFMYLLPFLENYFWSRNMGKQCLDDRASTHLHFLSLLKIIQIKLLVALHRKWLFPQVDQGNGSPQGVLSSTWFWLGWRRLASQNLNPWFRRHAGSKLEIDVNEWQLRSRCALNPSVSPTRPSLDCQTLAVPRYFWFTIASGSPIQRQQGGAKIKLQLQLMKEWSDKELPDFDCFLGLIESLLQHKPPLLLWSTGEVNFASLILELE